MKGYHQLTQRQRYIIEDMYELGKSCRKIALEVGVHYSTISREIRRHRNSSGGYSAKSAMGRALSNRQSIYDYRRKIEGLLEQVVIEKLNVGWSPEQICGRLKLESRWSLSHETIYRWIYKIRPEMKRCLRYKWRRKKRSSRNRRRGLEKYPRKLIDSRPAAANARAVLGHWERDLLEGLRGKRLCLSSMTESLGLQE